MRLPEELQLAIDQLVEKTSSKTLARAREEMTREYREGRVSPFEDEAKRLVYVAARMPATYAAVRAVLQSLPRAPKSLVDLGAGPGTATWAAFDLFPEIENVTLVERSPDAIALGKDLASHAPWKAFREATWERRDLPGEVERADVGVLSYVINEMTGVAELIRKCWDRVGVLVVIEPGTMKGAANIRAVRQQLIDLDGQLLSPCPHKLACPSDWCHFAARVERTRLHRQVKGGALGYEDEKFSYVVAAKEGAFGCQNRIVRHPIKGSGHVRLTLCTQEGQWEERVVSKKAGPLYRQARDASWGDPF